MSDSAAEKTFALFAQPGNKKFVAELEKTGAKLFAFAPIEAEEITSDEISTTVKEDLMSFDWLIFPDVLAVDFFLRLLEKTGTDLFELDALRFCAFGEAVADQLRFVQLHTDVIPNKSDSQTVLSSLKDYIGADNSANLKFLVLKEKSHKLELVEALRRETAEVRELAIYQAKAFDGKEIARIKTLLAGGAIDEFVFTAPTDFISLRLIFGDQPLNEIFSEIKVSAAGGNLYQMLKEHDFKHAGLFRLAEIGKMDK